MVTVRFTLGHSFGLWRVIYIPSQFQPNTRHRVVCQCQCLTIREMDISDVHHKVGHACRKCKKPSVWRHGHKKGYQSSPTYKSYLGMIERCTKPHRKDWANYGGRGITV